MLNKIEQKDYFVSLRVALKSLLQTFIIGGFLLGFVFIAIRSAEAAPGIRQTINFQGKLVDAQGLNVADNTYSVVFTLYDASSGGTQLWQETRSVTTVDGIFREELGSTTSLSSVDFGDDSLYLGIKIGTDPEMTPRVRFTASPYAFQARNVAWSGLQDALDDLAVSMGSYTTAFNYGSTTGTANLFTLSDADNNTGTGNLLNIVTGSSSTLNPLRISTAGVESLVVDASGYVGIGTTDPTQNLDIAGTVRIRGQIYDYNNEVGSPGQVLSTTATGVDWVDSSGIGTDNQNLLNVYSQAGNTVGLTAPYGDIRFYRGTSTEMLFLDESSGYVGIGTTSPTYKLNVSGGNTGAAFTTTDWSVGGTGSAIVLFTGANTGNTFGAITTLANGGGTYGNLVLQDQGGNVGIGTTAPSYRLDVNGDIRIVNGSELYSYGSATLGNRTYTEDNYVTDGQTFTASIDALDQQLADVIGGSGGVWSRNSGSGYLYPANIGDAVGIGTSSPGVKLDIVDTSAAANTLRVSNTAPGLSARAAIEIVGDGVTGILGARSASATYVPDSFQIASSGGPIALNPGNGTTALMTLTAGGSVGIGTTGPNAKFQVYSDGNSAIFGTGALTDSYIAIRDTVNGAYFGIDSSQNGGAGAVLLQGGSNKAIAFDANTSSFGAGNPDLYINATGNVGIGTTTQQQLLHLFGNQAALRISDDGGNSDQAARIQLSETEAGTVNAEIGWDGNANRIYFDTNGKADSFTILDGGNVGIGTSNPGASLDVVGNIRTDSRVLTSDGSEAQPAYRFTNDADVGMYRPGTNTLSLVTGGVDRIYINSSGNVGIGTSNPGYRLDINGDIRIASGSELYSNGSATLGARTYTTPSYVSNGETFTASIQALDNAVELIAAGGGGVWTRNSSLGYLYPTNLGDRVGIGTTSPGSTLSVVNDGTVGVQQIVATLRSTSTRPTLLFSENTSETITSGMSIEYDGRLTGTGNMMNILGVDGLPAFTVRSGGNVGIGTTSPSYKLDVVGTTEITPTTGNPTLFLGRVIGQPNIKAISDGYLIMDSDTQFAAINYYVNKNVILAYGGGNVGIGYNNPGTAKLAINGNVGIGTISPGAKLDVADNTSNGATLEVAGTQLMRYKYGPQGYNVVGAPMVLRYVDTAGGGNATPSYMIYFKARDDANDYLDEVWYFGTQAQYNSNGYAYTMQRISGTKKVRAFEITNAGNTLQIEWQLTDDGVGFNDSVEITVMEVLAGHLEGHRGTFSTVAWASKGSGTEINNGGNAHATFGGTGNNWLMGNVGIGTTNPSVLFEAAGTTRLRRGDGLNYIEFSGDSGGNYITSDDAGANQKNFYISASPTGADATDRSIIFRTGKVAGVLQNRLTIAGNGTATFAGAVNMTSTLSLSSTGQDLIDFSGNATNDARGISFNSRTALTADYNDGWLRLNQLGEFTSGVYTPGSLRVDGGINMNNSAITNINWASSDDGTGSGLDADLLDGLDSSVFVREIVIDDDITTRMDSGFYQTSTATTAEGWPQTTNDYYHLLSTTHSNTENYYAMQFAGNYRNSTDIYYRSTNGNGSAAWNKLWHAGNDGSGSDLDADLLDGLNQTSASTVSTIVARNSSGDINARLFRSEYDTTNATIGYIMTQIDTASNNYIRPSTPAQLVTGLGLEAGGSRDIWVEKAGDTMTGDLTLTNNFIDLGTVSTDSDAGVYWHTGGSQNNYGIFRTAGSWSAPAYQQLSLTWGTGIILNPGSSYGKSFVDVQGNGLRVSSGSIGIGTTNPLGLLHVSAGPVGDAVFRLEADTDNGGSENDNPRIQLVQEAVVEGLIGLNGDPGTEFTQAVSNALYLQTATTRSEPIQFATAGVGRMYIGGNGNVGIATTAPSYPFDVAGNGRVRSNLYIGTGGGYMFSDSGTRLAIPGDFYVQATSSNTYLYSTNTYLGNTSGDNIYTRGNTISGNSWSITGAGGGYFGGNVGIGTATLPERLTVSGNITFPAGATRTLTVQTPSTSNTSGNSLYLRAGNGTGGVIPPVGGNLYLDGGSGSSSTLGSHVLLATQSTMGNVGIGTTYPTQKLHVYSTTSADGVRIDGTTNPALSFATSGTLRGYLATSTTTNGYASGTLANDIVLRSEAAKIHLVSGAAQVPALTVNSSNFVGIGVTDTSYKFSVVATPTFSSANITNAQTTDSSNYSSLVLRVGTATTGVATRFLKFVAGATGDTGGTGVGRVRLNNGNVAYETGGADFAEYVKVSEPVNFGDLITLHQTKGSKAKDNDFVLGVVSNSAGFIGNARSENPGSDEAVVGLLGHIETKVIKINQDIREDDAITSSVVPGYGIPSDKEGRIVGRSLGSTMAWNESTCPLVPSLNDINWPGKRMEADTNVCFRIPVNTLEQQVQNDLIQKYQLNSQSTIYVGKVIVFVSPGWYKPHTALNAAGDFVVQSTENGFSTVDTSSQQVIDTVLTAQTTISSYIEAGNIETSNLQVSGDANFDNLNADSFSVGGYSLSQYIEDAVISGQLFSNIDSTVQSQSLTIDQINIEKNVLAETVNSLTETVQTLTARLDQTEQAISETQSDVENIDTRVVALEEFFSNITASESAILFQSPTASTSAQIARSISDTEVILDKKIVAEDDVSVLGTLSATDIAVIGKISNGILDINGYNDETGTPSATITTFGGELKLQHTGMNGIEMVAGKVKVDINGNVLVYQGGVDIAQGDLSIRNGSIKGSESIRGIDVEISEGSGEYQVTFGTPNDTTAYAVSVLPTWFTSAVIEEKTVDGFKIRFNQPAPANAKLDWIIIE